MHRLKSIPLFLHSGLLGSLPALLLLSPWARGEEIVSIQEEIPVKTVAASSEFSPKQPAANLTNKSGLTEGRHDANGGAGTMWHTAVNPAASVPAASIPVAPAWVRFDFDGSRTLSEIHVWNHNQARYTSRGFQKARLYGTRDGKAWFALSPSTVNLTEGGERASVIALDRPEALQGVILAAESNFGGDCFGLSEVTFHETIRKPVSEFPFPAGIECVASPVYRHRADGKAGREITVKFTGAKLVGDAELVTTVDGYPAETVRIAAATNGRERLPVLLPVGAAVDREARASIVIRSGKREVSGTVTIPPQRQWTIFLLPHSHVDIGYTNTQDNVEFIHRRNIQESIKIAKDTANYPEGARFKWDTEVGWPAERTLANGTEVEKKAMLDAIRDGSIHVGASYINDNTSVSADEEFDALFGPSERIGKLTGRKFDTLMQVDVPGMSWGTVTAAARYGIPYVLLLNNGGDRVGHSMELSHHPFWWMGPDGKSKVLCLQAGSYAYGAQLKGMPHALAIMGQTDRSKIPGVVKTKDPRANFIDAIYGNYKSNVRAAPGSGFIWSSLAKLEKDPLYPYDLFAMSWALADNTAVDADLPDAVKSWNEEYAYPKVVIASSSDIMRAFDRKYGSSIPSRKGEFTEYWSDGLGSAAKQTAMNRNAKERLIQADTLWSMLQGGKPAPREAFDEAWRHVLLGSEHTWCFSRPSQQPITNDILKVKFGYFQKAHDDSVALLAQSVKPVAAPGGQTLAVFNTLSWPHGGLVTLPEPMRGAVAVADETGNVFATQKLSSGETVFLAKEVPALGAANYGVTSKTAPVKASRMVIDSRTLDNGRVKVALDPQTGNIASLVSEGREFIKGAANSYHYLRGRNAPSSATGPTEVKISIKEDGPLVASLLVESKADGCNWLKREVRIFAGRPEVEIINTLDKIATNHKEGVHFGFAFDVPDPRTRMDIPWGVAEVDADFFPEGNRNWICFQRWLDISNAGQGVTWCALDAPTFEHGDMHARILGGANNSPEWLRKLPPSSTIYSWALNNHWHTNFPLSQSGVLIFRYSILPHGGGYDATFSNRFGMEQSRPLVTASVGKPVRVEQPVSIDNPRVVISRLKSGPEGLEVSLRSLSDQAETAVLNRPHGGKNVTVSLPPHGMEVVTLK